MISLYSYYLDISSEIYNVFYVQLLYLAVIDSFSSQQQLNWQLPEITTKKEKNIMPKEQERDILED
ncbi:uncharacterized protein CIMG_12589 [Coccidioides immitis RS]|uniref:Uncharacterized protein n=1 Tax=Coccidioides immitis (strain RS) TaxID=246410 RepID=A0A0D8JSG8_COCIM|nr:uncharacterized protein CIMG_12589 [Coccidioides immitis RS]KJF59926.1 hypothetical protein CIMG_12589 [Coccidioides immitis RS]